MRDPAEITQASAAYIAKWQIGQILKTDQSLTMMEQFAMQQAIQKNGAVDKIAKILYDAGLKITVDKNHGDHRAWIDAKAVILEKKS